MRTTEARAAMRGEVSFQLTVWEVLSLAVNVVQNGWDHAELPLESLRHDLKRRGLPGASELLGGTRPCAKFIGKSSGPTAKASTQARSDYLSASCRSRSRFELRGLEFRRQRSRLRNGKRPNRVFTSKRVGPTCI